MDRIKKILIGFLACILVIGVGFGLFYKFYLVKTPVYTIMVIERSISEHDSDTFQKHVNLNSLLSSALEDLTEIYEDEAGISFKNNIFGSEFFPVMQKYIVSASANDILNRIEGAPNRRLSDEEYVAATLINENIGYNISLEGIETIEENDNTAEVAIELYEEKLDHEFVLNLKMKKLRDGMWRVVECTNLKQYIVERNRIVNADFQ